jgi:hypothetical protein
MLCDKSFTYYLAGKMSNVRQFNIPMFDRVSADLRQQGYTVVSPAELDSPKMRALAIASPDGDLAKLEKDCNETWGEVLARDVKMVADKVQGVIILPGWESSTGARLELFAGLLTKKRFGWWDDNTGTAISASLMEIRRELKEYMP